MHLVLAVFFAVSVAAAMLFFRFHPSLQEKLKEGQECANSYELRSPSFRTRWLGSGIAGSPSCTSLASFMPVQQPGVIRLLPEVSCSCQSKNSLLIDARIASVKNSVYGMEEPSSIKTTLLSFRKIRLGFGIAGVPSCTSLEGSFPFEPPFESAAGPALLPPAVVLVTCREILTPYCALAATRGGTHSRGPSCTREISARDMLLLLPLWVYDHSQSILVWASLLFLLQVPLVGAAAAASESALGTSALSHCRTSVVFLVTDGQAAAAAAAYVLSVRFIHLVTTKGYDGFNIYNDGIRVCSIQPNTNWKWVEKLLILIYCFRRIRFSNVEFIVSISDLGCVPPNQNAGGVCNEPHHNETNVLSSFVFEHAHDAVAAWNLFFWLLNASSTFSFLH
ncbi:hypothetical protein LguiB_030147 [Lonicera macranthoides]